MDSTKRIIVNTLAQYMKAVFTTCLSLYSTRLILDALNISDYGIYSVVGGVVALLGFITNALIVTTQRYISYYHGQGEITVVRKFFTNSLSLHILLGTTLAFVLAMMKGWLFDSFLNIPVERIETAKTVYLLSIAMLLLTILMAPFKALFIARENIVFIAVVDSFDAIVKLGIAIGLAYITADKLLAYALLMTGIVLMNLLIFSIYAIIKFEECTLTIKTKDIGRQYLLPLIGFAGWTTFGMGASVLRTQGFAMVFNRFCGTTINAAYGIALQVFSALSVIVTSVLNAMNPQIMKAEGNGDRTLMFRLAFQESKFSTALLAIFTIPLIIEMPAILGFWLKEVPDYSIAFCRFILIAFICDQTTMGLHSVMQAIGQLRNYSLLVFTPKILNLPLVWFMLFQGIDINWCMATYLIIELGVAIIRIPYLKIAAQLDITAYIKKVILPLLPLFLISTLTAVLCTCLPAYSFRFVGTIVLSILAGMSTAWFFTITGTERQYVIKLINDKLLHAVPKNKSLSH